VAERFLKVGVADARAVDAGKDGSCRRPGEESGWQRREVERVDIYLRGKSRVRVIWRGGDAISGGSRFDEDGLEQYSRDLNTVKKWLA
jgi:hypothetical protein